MSGASGSWGGQKAVDDSESCDFGDLEGRWPEMSKFVSCGRNAENVNRLADFVLV